MSVSPLRLRLVVEGRVQGVGFRYATAREARRLGIDGWVRNTAAGAVEIVVEGEAAAVETLCDWCRQGPPSARVDRVSRRQEAVREELSGFEIRS
jgi:acylphosphatase